MPAALLPCVIDSSVLIDLKAGGLLRALLGLELYLMTPDFVFSELKDSEILQLQGLGLVVCESDSDQVRELVQLRASYGQPSFIDLSALALAKRMKALLLTNDKRLRMAAAYEGVDVHGTLWLLDEMLRRHVITPPVAVEALKQMLQDGSRLPKHECEKRLSRWEGRSAHTRG